MNGLNNILDTAKERTGKLKDRSDLKKKRNGKHRKVHDRQNRGYSEKH